MIIRIKALIGFLLVMSLLLMGCEQSKGDKKDFCLEKGYTDYEYEVNNQNCITCMSDYDFYCIQPINQCCDCSKPNRMFIKDSEYETWAYGCHNNCQN